MRVSRHSCRESVYLCHNYSTTTCFILLKVETVIKLPYYHHHCWQNRYLHCKLMWVVYITYALCLLPPCHTRCLLLCQMNYLHTAQTALASLKNVFPGKFQFSSCRTENKLIIVFTMRAVSVLYKIWVWLFWANYFCTMKMITTTEWGECERTGKRQSKKMQTLPDHCSSFIIGLLLRSCTERKTHAFAFYS